MNTVTALTWVLASKSADLKIHTCKRAGWDFVVRTPRAGAAALVALHQDGRASKTFHETAPAAKAAAIGLMHPSEAMGWPEFHEAGGRRSCDYRARWGDESFRAYRDELGSWQYWEDPNLPAVVVEGLRDARQRAVQRLVEVYGPVAPARPDKPADGRTQALESALRAAGIRFTAKQLAVAALALA